MFIVLFLLFFQLPQPPKHLTITTTASAAAAAPGSDVQLWLDIAPKPGIHVYAPGATDYLPIAVKVDAQAGVTIGKIKFPKSETMIFEGEKVPVYGKPFRIVQEITVARSLKTATTLTVTGTVKYQACDDKVCFIPAAAPVGWTIAIERAGKAGGAGRAGTVETAGTPGR